MLFNSLDFAIFLPIVFIIYWLIGSARVRLQNWFILFASYTFYAWWDWRFLCLILFSSGLDYMVGLGLLKYERLSKRRLLLWISLIGNLGVLFYFKYFGFFIDSFVDVARLFGTEFNRSSLTLILPVGISFYTFQTLSYTIDAFKKRITPTRDALSFFSFVSFFPQLVAGPIERARHLLPQFQKPRFPDTDLFKSGLHLILWGLFKKILIADICAIYVNQIFENSADLSGSTLLLGATLFMFQLYGDFSGYSDIAIGTGRLLGFKLSRNFAYPYFSRNVAETWNRWHMTLTHWFRDYLYLPLVIGRNKTGFKVMCTFIVFGLCGLWHGANWTFLLWGFGMAALFSRSLIFGRPKQSAIVAEGRLLPSLRELWQITTTFMLVTLVCILFRAESMGQVGVFYTGIFSPGLVAVPEILIPRHLLFLIIMFFGIEWLGREKECPISLNRLSFPVSFRWSLYYGLMMLIYYYKPSEQIEFIYFQF